MVTAILRSLCAQTNMQVSENLCSAFRGTLNECRENASDAVGQWKPAVSLK